MRKHTRQLSAISALIALAATGCAVPADKAGGDADAVTLTFGNMYAHLEYLPHVQHFIEEVERLSDGAVEIQVANEWRDFAPDFERSTLEDVAAGEIDLAWVGTRAFDLTGDTALQALTAPFLVDSIELQAALIESDIDDRMLDAVQIEGLDTLAILAGGLRRPFSVAAPLTSPASFAGITFHSFDSELADATTRALGAVPDHANPSGLDTGLQDGTIHGFEKQLSTVVINGTVRFAPYLATGAVLWPETIALVANSDRLAALSERQRGWLTDAAERAAVASPDLLPDDGPELDAFCAAGGRVGDVSPDDLARLRAAVDPLYETLRSDAVTDGFLDEITDLKQSVDTAPLRAPAECFGPAAAGAPPVAGAPDAETAAIEGVYRWELTAESAERAGIFEDPRYPWPNIVTMTLAEGTWNHRVRDARKEEDNGGGAYDVDGNALTLTWDDGTSMPFTFAVLDDGSLRVTAAPGLGPMDAWVLASEIWTRIE